jgi:hypothetical protein
MLEINFQYWIDNYNLYDFSNSIAISGDRNIGKITWNNALKAILDGYSSQDKLQMIITSTATRRQVISYFREFGAWEYSELNSMSNIELSALALQYIAGNYIECENETGSDVGIENCDQGYFYRVQSDKNSLDQGELWTTLSH